ncbi:hypothetical protein FOL47_008056 [Perkinsus chesapeaki]|uniref:RING-type domain-containing protein n=1 Tax=Perkinsus chesapeaki TaxID=330153 RepID=A0A7J6N240_PERCH|nr:hypothetical protein FOL47_008056 [Perkinsus chesapeaki]
MSRRFMVVWVAWVVLAVAYTVWIFESPDSKGANSPLMIVLMCILVAVPVIALFVGNRMVKKLFPSPSSQQHHPYRRDSVIDMEEGREGGGSSRRYGSIDTIMQDFTSDGFFKAWGYWVKDNTTTSTITATATDDNCTSSEEVKYEEPCAICLSDYQVGEVVRVLPCGHRFHTCCFDNCFASRPRGFKLHHVCPLCRAPLGPTNADIRKVRAEQQQQQEEEEEEQQQQAEAAAPTVSPALSPSPHLIVVPTNLRYLN